MTLAASQLSEETTVTNLLAMDAVSFDKALKAVRKAYKEAHLIAPEPRRLNYEGQKAFNLVLKRAKALQQSMENNYGMKLTADMTVNLAFKKLIGKLAGFSKEKWLMYFADRIATVLQSARVKVECQAQGLDMLHVAVNAVWMGYKPDGTAYADDIIRHGISGLNWAELNFETFNRKVICDYVKESDRMKGLKLEDYIEMPAPEKAPAQNQDEKAPAPNPAA